MASDPQVDNPVRALGVDGGVSGAGGLSELRHYQGVAGPARGDGFQATTRAPTPSGRDCGRDLRVGAVVRGLQLRQQGDAVVAGAHQEAAVAGGLGGGLGGGPG